MAPPNAALAGEIAVVRAASFRIGAASPHTLPTAVANVVPSLSQCKTLLALPQSTRQKDGEAGLVVHRLNTQIASFLQGRTSQERWAAAVLIKTCVETGGWEVLSKSASHWVAGLASNLKKPASPLAKTVTVMTITRIFTLTWGNPSLTREITTPALPGFISACSALLLGAADPCPKLVSTVLNAFIHLAPRHPATFRTFLDKLVAIAHAISGSVTQPLALRTLASRLSVILYQCKPKDTASSSWADGMTTIIHEAHDRLDHLFDGVNENWQSQSPRRHATDANPVPRHDSAARVEAVNSSAVRVHSLLADCTVFVSTATSTPVNMKLGLVLNLIVRLFSIAGDLMTPSPQSVQFKPDTTRDEQHALLAALPALHVSGLRYLHALIHVHRTILLPIMHTVLDQLVWIFGSEHSRPEIRSAVYRVLGAVLECTGSSLSKELVSPLSAIIRFCCEDAINASSPATQSGSNLDGKSTSVNADSISRSSSMATTAPSALNLAEHEAEQLLPLLLGKLPSKCVSDSIRIQLDRAALLTRSKRALIAAVLNPPALKQGQRASASLLPFLARHFPQEPEVEALLRPRVPLLQTTGGIKSDLQMENGDGDYGGEVTRGPEPDETMTEGPIEPASAGISGSGRKRAPEEIPTDGKRQRGSGRPVGYGDPVAQSAVQTTNSARSEQSAEDEVSRPVVEEIAALEVYDYAPSAETVAASLMEQPAETRVNVPAGILPDDDDDQDFVMPELDLREDSDDDDADE